MLCNRTTLAASRSDSETGLSGKFRKRRVSIERARSDCVVTGGVAGGGVELGGGFEGGLGGGVLVGVCAITPNAARRPIAKERTNLIIRTKP